MGEALSASLGGVEPLRTDPVTLRVRGRSQKWELSTGCRRDVRCHTDGRRRCTGVVAEPVPRRTSTASPASAKTERTVVTVLGLQPAATATRRLVTAQCRPLAPSAKRASAALTRVRRRCERCTRAKVHRPVGLAAHTATSHAHDVREVHIGVVAGTAPAVTIQVRRRDRKSAWASRGDTGPSACAAKLVL